VRKIHQSLTGIDPDGTRYRLDEPELLLWVHCGEVASCADIARRSGLPFSAADLDGFVGRAADVRPGVAVFRRHAGRPPGRIGRRKPGPRDVPEITLIAVRPSGGDEFICSPRLYHRRNEGRRVRAE
jgi:hypothetical protein